MDIHMPVLDGLETIRRIRQSAGGKAVKIICVSGVSFDEDALSALANGADDFIDKPFRAADLFERICVLLETEYVYADATVSE